MIRTVFFDLYQTLISYDPPREEWEARVLDELGVKASAESFKRSFILADEYFYTENAKKAISQRTPEEISIVYARHQSIVLKEAGIEPDPNLLRSVLLRFRDTKFGHKLFDDVIPALTELQRHGLVLGLISNIDKDIIPLLEKLGLDTFLNIVVTSQETGFTKPHPEIFKEALRRSGNNAENTMFIGDQYQIDFLGATAVGMKGALIDRDGLIEAPQECPKITDLVQITNLLEQ